MPLTRRTNKAAMPLTRRTTSAVSAANACEGITCLWQVTRNGSDEAERSERSPPGVARNAGDEGLAAPGRTSKRRSRARERKCPATRPASATGEGLRGTCAHVPRSHPQAEGAALTTLRAPCLCLHSKIVTLRAPCLFLTQCKAEYKTHAQRKSGDESPHSKVTARPYGRCAHGLTRKLNGGRSTLRALCLFLMQYKTVPGAGTLPIGGPGAIPERQRWERRVSLMISCSRMMRRSPPPETSARLALRTSSRLRINSASV